MSRVEFHRIISPRSFNNRCNVVIIITGSLSANGFANDGHNKSFVYVSKLTVLSHSSDVYVSLCLLDEVINCDPFQSIFGDDQSTIVEGSNDRNRKWELFEPVRGRCKLVSRSSSACFLVILTCPIPNF